MTPRKAPATGGTPKKRARKPVVAPSPAEIEEAEIALYVLGRSAWVSPFLEELKTYGSISNTARACGISRSTVYREMKQWPRLRGEVDAVLAECVELVEGTLFQMALMPDATTDRIFYLKTHKPEKYAERLNPSQIADIQREARAAALKELQDEIGRLPEAARKIVMASMAAVAAKEITP